ncbi:hypothetical protein GCM10009127_07360 [Alteraurantiacibacter aestuarii]|uniref:Tip attachment protein J domain-containing protein n=1 Tax=Alteraurantiacibacter aestuarii TaxID=650004 RepID=A0A844ZNA2_9SPHN|nr:phage tail protein [Alteraurantiacibacter aestuarii]MXO87129.1 hypothetical protein [Alteraurantiacibacter aestuarii]
MATILFSAVGTAIGGPIGGTIGALLGNAFDQKVSGSGRREGPRLQELRVTTSSYGTPIARHYGKVRTPGSVIWATDLVENSEKSGGGKGRPSTTTYNYSVSFAVALASRPIKDIGRIWADGNLLRGAGGDLKFGGELRIYRGHGDQQPDPLIDSALGGSCPAFRGLAYCVFESLQLADFGNRIPTLTFEIIADDGDVSLSRMMPRMDRPANVERPLHTLQGFSEDGGSFASSLAVIDEVYPLICNASGNNLTIGDAEAIPANPPLLPEAAADPRSESFASVSGESSRRQPDLRDIPEGIRYYDTTRDFQAGLQRAGGRARAGRSRIIEFPGALEAENARDLASKAAERASWARESLSWRVAELDPGLEPGQVVRVPGRKGYWRIINWEWRESGVELELQRMPHGPARSTIADAGQSLTTPDMMATPTVLRAYELPWDGKGPAEQRQVFAAASSSTAGWTGSALYAVEEGSLAPIGQSGRQRSVIGQLESDLPPSDASLLDRGIEVDVTLLSADFQLPEATIAGLAKGANRALIGEEIVQFASATRLDEVTWRLSHFLRGRGGTEGYALAPKPAGTPFILLGDEPVPLDDAKLGLSTAVAATGLVDADPVVAQIAGLGASLRPLCPVHPRMQLKTDGSIALSWTRRARGAWEWRDGVEVPINEQAEKYLVGIGDTASPAVRWEVTEPCLNLSVPDFEALQSSHAGQVLWVRQVGNHASSAALHLLTIS